MRMIRENWAIVIVVASVVFSFGGLSWQLSKLSADVSIITSTLTEFRVEVAKDYVTKTELAEYLKQ